MKPEEKAKELFNRFRNLENKDSWINNHNAKDCALICINEMLEYTKTRINFGFLKPLEAPPEYEFSTYLNNVKQEIEKL